jgi:signal peptidase I
MVKPGTVDSSRPVEQPPPRRSFLAELPVLVIVAFLLALVLKTFLVQAFYIPSQSMQPTLEIGDRVLVNKLVYDLREPRRGDVVVFRDDALLPLEPGGASAMERIADLVASGLGTSPSERDLIKRVIGLPGETIEMRDGVVYADGRPVPEEEVEYGGYLLSRDLVDYGPVVVPEGEYFMMGDNRPNSADSRFQIGTVEREEIIGRAFVVMWPVTRIDVLPGADYGAPAAG